MRISYWSDCRDTDTEVRAAMNDYVVARLVLLLGWIEFRVFTNSLR